MGVENGKNRTIFSRRTYQYPWSCRPELLSMTEFYAVKWSFAGLMITSLFQSLFFYFRSTALLTDTIHNLGNAATANP